MASEGEGRSTTTTPATTTTTNAVFGSGFKSSGFGAAALAAGGFDPSKFATSKVTAADGKHDDENDGENDGDEDVEKECDAEFKPVVKLEIIEGAEATTTGEENEDILFEAKVKSYRFTDGEWKERGLGPIKLLEHKKTKKIRVLMRRDKTLKICANFYVQQESKVAEHAASEKACVFTAMDCSDGDIAPELYNMCIKFGSADKRQQFTDAFNAAQKKMAALPKDADAEHKEEQKAAVAAEADKLAEVLGETKVEVKHDEDTA